MAKCTQNKLIKKFILRVAIFRSNYFIKIE